MLEKLTQPTNYARRILLSVIGLTPQVITETLYAIAHQTPENYPTELHVVTTSRGQHNIALTLLSENPGWLRRLEHDFHLPPVAFSASHIHLLKQNNQPLEDIRTDSDNQKLADLITQLVATLTQDTNASLHISIAGGRKTMSYYAGYALSLFGRAQDQLSHVLVSEPFESHPDFFYPTPYQRVISDRQNPNNHLDAQHAKVSLAYIPFVRIRHELPSELFNGKLTFSQTVQRAQIALTPPHLEVDWKNAKLFASGQHIPLSPILLAFYRLFIDDRLLQGNGLHYVTHSYDMAKDFLRYYSTLINPNSGDFEQTEKAIRREGIDKAYFDEKLSRIKKAFEKSLGKEVAKHYLPVSQKRNQPKYLALATQNIILSEE